MDKMHLLSSALINYLGVGGGGGGGGGGEGGGGGKEGVWGVRDGVGGSKASPASDSPPLQTFSFRGGNFRYFIIMLCSELNNTVRKKKN